jgi:hypothetical protein
MKEIYDNAGPAMGLGTQEESPDNLQVIGQRRFVAGETAVLVLEYHVGQRPLEKGGHLWLLADIRQIPGSFQATDPGQPGYVRAWAMNGQSLPVTCPGEGRPGDMVRTLDLLPAVPEFLHVVEVRIEDRLLVPVKAIRFEIGGDAGWPVPCHAIDQFNFWAVPDPEGNWQFELIDGKYHSFLPSGGQLAFPKLLCASISVVPRSPRRLDMVIPSNHRPGEPIPVRFRLFDELENPFGSLGDDSHRVVQTTQVVDQEMDGDDLDVVVTGDAVHSVVRLEAATYISGLKGAGHRINIRSNPSWGELPSESEHVYWGILHGMFFNQRPLDDYFDYARDVAALDFCAGQHFTYEAALPGVWARTRETVSRYHDPGKFVTFLGVECDPGPCGHKIILYRDTEVPPLLAERRSAVRSGSYLKRELAPDTVRCDTVEDLWRALHALGEGQAMVTAHHTADWHYHDPVLQRLAEIYSKWGTCEYPGNPLDRRPAIPPREYVQEALGMGHRLGIIAGGDTHDSRPGNQGPEPFGLEFPDGLTAVFATSLTREAIWDALWHRRTYGTTGARILLQFEVNGVPMGGEVNLAGPAEIKIEAVGTAPIRSIELIRDNQVFRRWQGGDEQVYLEWTDDVLASDQGRYYPGSYRVRLTQLDGQMAWSSPVWSRRL